MIRRPPRSTQSRSSAASDVYKRQGIYTIQMPAFQSSTPSYMGRKGLNPDIGGIILEFEESEGKLVSTKTQYVNYRTVENDY